MSDSDRGWIGAVGFGLAILIAILGSGYLWSEASALDSKAQIEAKQQTDQQADRAREDAQLECAIVSPKSDNCVTISEQGARPDQRGEQDLAAQRTMAAWTQAMGKAAIIGMAVGIIGLGLIFVTFKETRRSANETRRSVDSFIQAERARINVIKQDFARVEEKPQFLIDIKVNNFGRSPARIREIHWLGTDSIDWNDNGLRMSASKSLSKVIKPDDAWEFLHTINVAQSAKYVAGWVLYQTQFSKFCKTYFLWRIGEVAHSDEDGSLYALQEQGGKNWPEDT